MNAKTGRENSSRGADLGAFRGPEPKLGEVLETAAPPVDDDAGGVDRAVDGDLPAPTNQDQPQRDQDDDQERSEPRPPPSEEARAKISARFRQNRDNPPDDLDGQGGDDPAKAKDQNDETAKPRPDGGVSDSGVGDKEVIPAEKPMTLTVLGKTVSKSLDEVAALAELSVEEVRENPARAIKYAQRELATQSRLSEANEFRRSAKPAPAAGDDTGERPDPNKDRKTPGSDDDDSGQPDADRKTTGSVDFEKLAEAIQIDDPKTAGKKLAEALNTVAAEQAGKVRKDIDQDDTDKRVRADKTASIQAITDFVGEHKHVAADPFTANAMSVALTQEYKADLETALEAEGDTEALEYLRDRATPNQIANAHQARRLKGDPRVRQINKEFVAKAYQRLPEGLRGKIDPNAKTPPAQDLATTRQERKANLTPQPRRASTPPAQPPAKKEPMTRASSVARMREGRGQGGKPVSV